MSGRPLLQREAELANSTVSVRWDRHELVAGRADERLSATLLAAGVVATSRSLKYRRPRGPYCLRGDCGTCLVRVDGLPNQRACMTGVRHGMQVERQNRAVREGPDPTALADKFFGKEMDHHHFMLRPRMLNQIMQGVARNLAGLGRIPDAPREQTASHEHFEPDVLVVGAGPAGRAAALAIRSAGRSCVLVDRRDELGWDEPPGSNDQPQTAVFGVYADERTIGAIRLASASRQSGEADVLRTFAPRAVVIATGAREPMLPIDGNDIPGVVAAEGLARLLRRESMQPAQDCVVIGPRAPSYAEPLHARALALPEVVEIEGGNEVEAVRTKSGSIECGLVALAPAPAPASDLARQAGAKVQWDGSGFAVTRDEQGRCAEDGPWSVWASGDVCGFMGPAEAEQDGERIGRAVAKALAKAGAKTSAKLSGGRGR